MVSLHVNGNDRFHFKRNITCKIMLISDKEAFTNYKITIKVFQSLTKEESKLSILLHPGDRKQWWCWPIWRVATRTREPSKSTLVNVNKIEMENTVAFFPYISSLWKYMSEHNCASFDGPQSSVTTVTPYFSVSIPCTILALSIIAEVAGCVT